MSFFIIRHGFGIYLRKRHGGARARTCLEICVIVRISMQMKDEDEVDGGHARMG